MKIDRLIIKNFKTFELVSLDLEPGVNVFVGSNGSGKTSMLEAINIAIGDFFSSQDAGLSRVIRPDEVRISQHLRQEEASVTATSKDVKAEGWIRSFHASGNRNDRKGLSAIADMGQAYFDKYFLDPNDSTIAPLIAYYSSQRVFKNFNHPEKQKYGPDVGRSIGYLLSLEEIGINDVLEEWLKNAITKRDSKVAIGIEATDFVLENVEKAVENTLMFVLDEPEDLELHIYHDPDFGEIFLKYDEDHDLPLSYYSDGFKNLLYLVIDLVWRASQLNPWMNLEELSAQVTGVVTIDEIDLHFHPRWQVKAVDVVSRLFPHVQFFITTHSPSVVGNLEHGALFLIADHRIERFRREFFGKQISNVLRTILGGSDRHIRTQQKFSKLFNLIEVGDREAYRDLFNELFNQLGYEDKDISKARALMAMENM